MAELTLTFWHRERLRQARLHQIAGGVHVNLWGRGHQELEDAGLAYRSGDRLAITKAGLRALDGAEEVAER